MHTQYVVEDIRTTKSFATRKVEAWQDWATVPGIKKDGKNGTKRRVMIMLMDFQVPEKASMFEYNVMPMHADPLDISSPTVHVEPEAFKAAIQSHYSSPDQLPTYNDYLSTNYTPEVKEWYPKIVPFEQYYDIRPVINSMGAQKILGIAFKAKTHQDVETVTRRTSTHWVKAKQPPASWQSEGQGEARGEYEAISAFMMDAPMANLPLIFTSQPLLTPQSSASLEVSLRFLRPPDLSKWVLQEQNTEAATGGRTLTTDRIWDGEGRLVAVMTQVGIMRPKARKAKSRGKREGKDAKL